MKIEELRKKIDEVDTAIVRLIAERLSLAEHIGCLKRKQGQQIEDRQRENVILEHIREIACKKGINETDIEGIYRKIFTTSKSIQGAIVAFQGEIGAYSEEAAANFFGAGIQVKPFESFEKVFKSVERDESQFGIIPIENSIEGSISKSYDLLLDSTLKVCGEIELPVSHCLIANRGVTLSSIKRIYSHPQALGQSQAFIKHLNCELIPTYDTAGSVKFIKEKKITDGAAIASPRAAEIYCMNIITCGIEDNPNNFTRFFVLSKDDAPPSGHDKTSVVFAVKHKPGALFEFLKQLAINKINMTKLESRPTRQKPWDYNFYLDFDGHRLDSAVKETLIQLEDYVIFMKVLGSYPKARFKARE
ncbi:MAG: prephenate dehydratase [Dehalococcoidia bacterium]|nr:MAG: prephenate dehydratase [Dehalococcoidia bacterium]